MTRIAPAAGSYFVVVDGIAFPGAFTLHVEATLGMGAASRPMRTFLRCPPGRRARPAGRRG